MSGKVPAWAMEAANEIMARIAAAFGATGLEMELIEARNEVASIIASKAGDVTKMREALVAIIEECPSPKRPYGMRVVELARTAIAESAMSAERPNP